MGLIGGEPSTNYAVNLLVLWAGNAPAKVPASFPDGASTTVMMFERYAKCADTRMNPWGKADKAGARADLRTEVARIIDYCEH